MVECVGVLGLDIKKTGQFETVKVKATPYERVVACGSTP